MERNRPTNAMTSRCPRSFSLYSGDGCILELSFVYAIMTSMEYIGESIAKRTYNYIIIPLSTFITDMHVMCIVLCHFYTFSAVFRDNLDRRVGVAGTIFSILICLLVFCGFWIISFPFFGCSLWISRARRFRDNFFYIFQFLLLHYYVKKSNFNCEVGSVENWNEVYARLNRYIRRQ